MTTEDYTNVVELRPKGRVETPIAKHDDPHIAIMPVQVDTIFNSAVTFTFTEGDQRIVCAMVISSADSAYTQEFTKFIKTLSSTGHCVIPYPTKLSQRFLYMDMINIHFRQHLRDNKLSLNNYTGVVNETVSEL